MRVMVKSQRDAEEYCKDCINPTYVISITTPGDPQANIHPEHSGTIKAVLRLAFDDVEADEPRAITTDQAMQIKNFINNHWEEIAKSDLLVHCGAGISRSAGAAAAILLAKTGSDDQIMENGRYTPNRTVYREVLNQFLGSMSDEEIEQRFFINTQRWAEQHQEELG